MAIYVDVNITHDNGTRSNYESYCTEIESGSFEENLCGFYGIGEWQEMVIRTELDKIRRPLCAVFGNDKVSYIQTEFIDEERKCLKMFFSYGVNGCFEAGHFEANVSWYEEEADEDED